MAEESSATGSSQAKREKLVGFSNWPVWSGITESMLIKKDVWDLVLTGPRPARENPGLWSKEVKEDRMAVGIAQRIIREGVSDQITFNIMDIKDPKQMWDKLKSICSEVGQGVVYSILQELFHYPSITKPKGYEKPVMQIFAEVRYLCKRLRTAMTPNRDLWDTIAIVIAFDSLHQDFDTTTASLLETGDKSIDEIQSILQSKEAKNRSKRATGDTGDLAMAFRDKGSSAKRKATSEDEYYNCHKYGHFGRDCFLPDKRLANRTNTQQPRRDDSRRSDSRRGGAQRRGQSGGRSDTPNRAHQAKHQQHEDDSDPEPFAPGPVGTIFMAKEQLQKLGAGGTWFLDSCASRHLCNDRKLFSDLRAKSIDFMTAAGQVIRTEEIGTVSIPLANGNKIDLQNVALAPGCDSNLISLGQLRETGITFHDNPTEMTLMRNGKVIAQAKRDRNLFTLELAQPSRAMATIKTISMQPKAMAIHGRGRPTHLVSQNKRVRLWHRRLAHISNARVVRASKLIDGIDLGRDGNEGYDPAEVLIDSDNSDASSASDFEEVPTMPSGAEATQAAIVSQAKTDDADILDKLCTPCVGSKSTRVVRRDKSMTATSNKLEEVHADLWGPHDPPSQSGSTYAAILMCEHTRKTWNLYLRGKDDFVDAFQTWLPRVEAESSCSMKVLRADGGGEFISIKLKSFCEKRGIVIKYAAPYVHEENRFAERGWRTIVTMKDSMLIDSGLPNGFWAEAMETANYLRNRLPTRSKNHGEVIPEEAWTGQRQNLQHVRIFGSLTLSNIPPEKRTKSDYQKVWQGILVGYSTDTKKHFCIWAPQTK